MARKDISFGNLNLLNLNLPGAPIYNDADGLTDEEYKAKIGFSSRLVRELDADVIGFQECWDAKALADIFAAEGLAGEYDLIARSLEPRKIQVALAVRKGMLRGEPEWIETFPEDVRFVNLKEARDARESVSVTIGQFSRPVLRAVVKKANGTPDIVVFVVHLKSKGPTDLEFDGKNPVLREHSFIARTVVSHVRRIVEAGALRAILNKQMDENDDPYVVLGDVNDGTNAISTELLTGSPGYRFFAKSVAGTRSDLGLYTVEKLQRLRSFQHVYYTYIFKNQMESLDHILVSDSFYDHSAIRKWSFREMSVFNDYLTASDRQRREFGYSDHGALVARFDWNPMLEEVEKILAEEEERS